MEIDMGYSGVLERPVPGESKTIVRAERDRRSSSGPHISTFPPMPLTSRIGCPLLPRSRTNTSSPSACTSLSRVVALAATEQILPARADAKRGPFIDTIGISERCLRQLRLDFLAYLGAV